MACVHPLSGRPLGILTDRCVAGFGEHHAVRVVVRMIVVDGLSEVDNVLWRPL